MTQDEDVHVLLTWRAPPTLQAVMEEPSFYDAAFWGGPAASFPAAAVMAANGMLWVF